MTLLDKANAISPKVCRILARKMNGRRPMSCEDIALASGLSKSHVAGLSKMESWVGVPIDTVVRFALACGVNHMKTEAVREYMRRRKMAHLFSGTKTQRVFLNLLMIMPEKDKLAILYPDA